MVASCWLACTRYFPITGTDREVWGFPKDNNNHRYWFTSHDPIFSCTLRKSMDIQLSLTHNKMVWQWFLIFLQAASEILRYLWQEGVTQEKAVILVGNKCDLARARVISSQGKQFNPIGFAFSPGWIDRIIKCINFISSDRVHKNDIEMIKIIPIWTSCFPGSCLYLIDKPRFSRELRLCRTFVFSMH